MFSFQIEARNARNPNPSEARAAGLTCYRHRRSLPRGSSTQSRRISGALNTAAVRASHLKAPARRCTTALCGLVRAAGDSLRARTLGARAPTRSHSTAVRSPSGGRTRRFVAVARH